MALACIYDNCPENWTLFLLRVLGARRMSRRCRARDRNLFAFIVRRIYPKSLFTQSNIYRGNKKKKKIPRIYLPLFAVAYTAYVGVY